MELERVSVPLEGWFGFIRENFVELFKKLFRVNLYALAAVVLALLAIGAGAVSLLYLTLGIFGWILLAIGIFLAIILIVVARLITLASYKIVEEQHDIKREVDIIGVAKQKAVPAISYGLILIAIYAVVLIPFGLLGLAVTIATGVVTVGPFIQLGLMLVSVLVGFFLQFTLFELVLEDKGPIESMRASFGLAKRNFWETVVFYIVRSLVSWVVSIPFVIVLMVLIFGAIFLGLGGSIALAAMSSGFTPFVIVIAIILLVLVFIPYALAYSSANETALLSLSYRYWRTIRGDMGPVKPPASGTSAPVQTASTSGTQPSQSRAMTTTVESPVMVAPATGAMATMPPQISMAVPKPAAKKAPSKKSAPKRAANKKSP